MPSTASTQRIVLACVAVITILAWAYLVHLDRQMSASMIEGQMMADMGMAMSVPWTMADLGFTFVMWLVMMVGMMTASVAPMLLVVAGRARSQEGHGRGLRTALSFATGYFLVWAGFSAAAALAQWALHEATLLSPMMTTSNARISGAILIGAGLYQMTPQKGACLAHCRSPLDFLMSHWRTGRFAAERMGAHHGAYCLGCCWALMAVLFTVGVMNLAWVAAIAVFVLLEKTGPVAVAMSKVAGAALVIFGLFVLLRPA